MTTEYEKLLKSATGRKALCVEQTITNVTELLCAHLNRSRMKRKELAERIGVTPGRITQLLDGHANLTLASIARALAVFDHVLEVSSRPVDDMAGTWVGTRPAQFEDLVGFGASTSMPSVSCQHRLGNVGEPPNSIALAA